MLEKILLQIKILQIQIQILLLQKKLTVPNLNDPKYIVIHHGAGQLNFEQVNEYHRQRWGFMSSLGYYIGYGYFISYSGRVYQGRADNEEQAATIGYNKCSINIGLQGDFEKEEPTLAQLTALEKLVKEKMAIYNINRDNVKGHRNFADTLCPGRNLYQWVISFK